MTRLARALVMLAAVAGAAAALRKLRRLADPDPSVYGHPAVRRPPGP